MSVGTLYIFAVSQAILAGGEKMKVNTLLGIFEFSVSVISQLSQKIQSHCQVKNEREYNNSYLLMTTRQVKVSVNIMIS